jgi:hypothetical protein
MMCTKRSIYCLGGIVLSFMLGNTGLAMDIPKEPGEENLLHEDVNIMTGLYIREYSLQGDGVVDYRTARQIIFYENNKFWNTEIETVEWPLFYWLDDDRDGIFEHFVDQRVEGNADYIIPYLPVSENSR